MTYTQEETVKKLLKAQDEAKKLYSSLADAWAGYDHSKEPSIGILLGSLKEQAETLQGSIISTRRIVEDYGKL